MFKIEDEKAGDFEFAGSPPKNDREAAAISVAKWELVIQLHESGVPRVAGALNWANCGFCMLYYQGDACDLCPVNTIGGGEHECNGTPFEEYWRVGLGDTPSTDEVRQERLRVARDELAFLQEIKVKLEGGATK